MNFMKFVQIFEHGRGVHFLSGSIVVISSSSFNTSIINNSISSRKRTMLWLLMAYGPHRIIQETKP